MNETEMQITSATGRGKSEKYGSVHIIQQTMNGYVLGWHWG